ncbi:protocadherin gamma-B1-like isoform X1 [Cricetulus griseus]|uniref:protocadherin gamma-B1-like isoform X1 n=1 Tax=Cricetulus griseus TaxID=10029 RepID=UPI0004548ACB|nr:protocadherin gamma-B1-like isoform X1 [Cricetulus griseus]
MANQVLLHFLVPLFCGAISQPIHYSIPEELAKGSPVGNLAQDLGLSVQELPARKLRVSAEDYFSVSAESGDLLVSGRIDREKICGRKSECALEFESVTENPMNIFHVTVAIQDINDNAPHFFGKSIELEICESALPGVKFPLDSARDADVGSNSLKMYTISPNSHFSLSTKESPDGSKYPELLLERVLDREHQSSHHLLLTAIDGGDPPLSSTTQIWIRVTDANDNAPVFSQDIYKASLRENMPRGTFVLQVTATDQDESVNGEITYAFLNGPASTNLVFSLDPNTGAITTNGTLDFEEKSRYVLGVEARDGGVHTAHCNVQIEILDENDNAPEVTFMSFSNQIPEDSVLGTVIALIKVRDKDSGQNGLVICHIQEELPFKLQPTSKNYYKLVIDKALNRERTSEYNVTIMATDSGKPSLSSKTCVTVHITDINKVLVGDRNDNAPRVLYPALEPDGSALFDMVPRAAEPGYLVTKVVAVDADSGHNAWLSYHVLQASDPGLFSLGLRTGEVRTARALGERDTARQRLLVAVRDGGQPPLSATATLHLIFADSLQEVLPDLSDDPLPSDSQSELQFYLVAALALISVLFLLAVILAIALRLRHSSSSAAWSCFQPGLSWKSQSVIPPNCSEGTLPYSYNLCVASHSTTAAGFNFLHMAPEIAPPQDLLCDDPSVAVDGNNEDPKISYDPSSLGVSFCRAI